METVDKYEKVVKNALLAAGTYTQALDLMVMVTASSLRTIVAANRSIDKLDDVCVKTSQGMTAHPAFRIRKEAEESIIKCMKQLGLTADALKGVVEEDPLEDMTQYVITAGKPKPRAKAKPKQ